MITIILENFLLDCPLYWKNFLTHYAVQKEVIKSMSSKNYSNIAEDIINQRLNEYDAIFYSRKVHGIEKSYVEFNDESALVVFKLRFG